jgi:hypothetical protein
MKKLIFLLSLALLSCEKEPTNPACSCGIITSQGIENDCYYFYVKNDCSGNTKKFCMIASDWVNFNVGDGICLTDKKPW